MNKLSCILLYVPIFRKATCLTGSEFSQNKDSVGLSHKTFNNSNSNRISIANTSLTFIVHTEKFTESSLVKYIIFLVLSL